MAALPVASSSPSSAAAAVRCEAVSLSFPRSAAVLDDVSFTLAPGSFHFLTGPSGAGKSSLLQLLTLSLTPTAGRLTLLGRDATRPWPVARTALRRRIGLVHQDYRLLDHLSVFDNAALPLLVRPKRPKQWRTDVEELLDWVGLGSRLQSRPEELSGGERQRLAIARAVVGRPELLLADEPTASVDAAMSLRLLRLFVELNRLGTTVLIATHDDELVARSGRPVLRLEAGRLITGGNIDE